MLQQSNGLSQNLNTGGEAMILIMDNYDSFTYNLYQYIGIFQRDVKVVRNDKITLKEIEDLNPEKIILSPGPGNPKGAGICVDLVKYFYRKIPILGICLGHQCIGEAFGAEITYAKELMHGKQSSIYHQGDSIFKGIPSPVLVARYHSLGVDEKQLSKDIKILAKTADGEIMAMEHKEYPVVGIQFHPESIYTEHGKRMIENFINRVSASSIAENE